MKNLFLFFFTVITFHLHAQQTFTSSDPSYIKNVKAGEAALNAEKYDSCLVYYKEAFKIKQTSILSTLRAAACAYSSNDKIALDQYLDIAFGLSWEQTKAIFTHYPEFQYLMGSSFEQMINDRWKEGAKEAGFDVDLMLELQEIDITDQLQRGEMRQMGDSYGWQSPQMDSLWVLQNKADSANQNRIEEIIEEYGYPGRSLVGSQGSTAFMVIQHSNQEMQEKYLPLLKEQADEGEILWSSVALMIDRVLLGKGEKQIYGSQVYTDQKTGEQYFGEIENPYKVDSIRNTVGLGTIQEYGDNWHILWDPSEHLSRHKKIKAEKAKTAK